MGLMAGYGIQLWPILQDVHQLRALYERRAGTFLSNAGVLQIFGVNDHDSAKLVSDLLGQETLVFETIRRPTHSDEPGLSFGSQPFPRPLLPPAEVRTPRQDAPPLLPPAPPPPVPAHPHTQPPHQSAGRLPQPRD